MTTPDPIPARLAALKTTPTPELKAQWRDLFDSEPPPFNRRYLESRLAYRIQELAYGGLKPETIRRLERLGEELDGGDSKKRSIRADRDQLFRVLSNLVRNARQAIEATRKPGTIEIGAGEDENDWWIRIGDTGPGLPPKAREYLFQPFSGGSRKGGTGLGLAIAADLVRNHGGRLELVRSDEEGTQFLLLLPRELVGISPRTAAAEAG